MVGGGGEEGRKKTTQHILAAKSTKILLYEHLCLDKNSIKIYHTTQGALVWNVLE